ncbi:Angiopoietin-related protein 5 [Collichthys lucidus]|uniref:Angiopoietin-related protein 5 n=1 Tax=Collichthys lucidus TaxID=240159 RepID=A0A4U5V579_COLLU|nr:Angiopoietin-related protein 5 [Collichthys lucidus]
MIGFSLLELFCLCFHFLCAEAETRTANVEHSDRGSVVRSSVEDFSSSVSRIWIKGRETCSIPCDITIKLLRDEKHSVCGQLQQSLLAFGRSTRKLMRDVMEEQQRALDILSGQVMELMTKVQTLSFEVQRSNSEMYSIKPVQSHDMAVLNILNHDIRDSLMSVVPKIPSGIYIVHPENTDSSFEVFCEMDYMGGGWTVMQRRTDGLTDFKRPWADYADGFGNLAGEHWLGLKKVFHIVNQKDTRFQLHMALVSHDDITSYASYDDFHLDSETQFFSIHLGRYAGTHHVMPFAATEQEQNQDTAPFSASDVDNDGCNPFCSIENRTVEKLQHSAQPHGMVTGQCHIVSLNNIYLDMLKFNSGPYHNTDIYSNIEVQLKLLSLRINRISSCIYF